MSNRTILASTQTAAPSSRLAGGAVLVQLIMAAGLVVATAVIHLHLWAERDGYRQVPTVGPLFLAQGIAGCVLAVLLVLRRSILVVLAAIAYMAASIAGLAISVRWGLFGYDETMHAPFAGLALAIEIAGLVILLVAAAVLVRSPAADSDDRRRHVGP